MPTRAQTAASMHCIGGGSMSPYGEFSANSLECMITAEPPWINARKGYERDDSCTVAISLKDMGSFYSSICKEDFR